MQLLRQIGALEPEPLFFANLGDFAGPGSLERHRWYAGLVDALPCPSISVVGNHDLDDATGWDNYATLHGPVNYSFRYCHTRFVVLHSEPGIRGEIDVPGIGTPEGTEGPRDEDLAFLDAELNAADEPHRVVLMHMPPHLGGHYAPHEDWDSSSVSASSSACCTHTMSSSCAALTGSHSTPMCTKAFAS